MGKPVTIDSDDLETLLYSAGAMTHIEQALYAAKHDFQYRSAMPKIASAIERTNHERLKALAYERPVTSADLWPGDAGRLRKIFADDPQLPIMSVVVMRSAPGEIPITALTRPRELGLVEIGTVLDGIHWADKTDIVPAKDGRYALRLSSQGRRILATIITDRETQH